MSSTSSYDGGVFVILLHIEEGEIVARTRDGVEVERGAALVIREEVDENIHESEVEPDGKGVVFKKTSSRLVLVEKSPSDGM